MFRTEAIFKRNYGTMVCLQRLCVLYTSKLWNYGMFTEIYYIHSNYGTMVCLQRLCVLYTFKLWNYGRFTEIVCIIYIQIYVTIGMYELNFIWGQLVDSGPTANQSMS